jgi:hypothetical protein
VTPLGCPICLEGAESLLGDGLRSGAVVLALVAAAVVGAFARFAWRLAKIERSL